MNAQASMANVNERRAAGVNRLAKKYRSADANLSPFIEL
jgi:hypothetical protein